MKTLTIRSILTLTLALTLAACGGEDPAAAERGVISDPGPVKADGSNSCRGGCGSQAPSGCWCDELCEGFGDCCSDYQPLCVPITTCANLKCAAGYHCEMKGINGGAVPACIKDPTCADLGGACLPLTYPMGSCASDEIADDSAGLCAPLPGSTSTCCRKDPDCAKLACPADYHCEMKGINGGAVPACIKN
jgi:hypothetical protein